MTIRASGDVTADGGFSIPQLIDVMDKRKKVTKMPNPTFVKFGRKWKRYFLKRKK
jgi:hypothetical protein